MTNYISYLLLKKIKTSSNFLKQNGYEFKIAHDDVLNGQDNLLKRIAREIFLQSETEPCGLKGCKISIYFEETEEINHLLSQFRFDSTSSLTTFELSLIIKKDKLINISGLTGLNSTRNNISNSSSSKAFNVNSNENQVQIAAPSTANSPFATLTRRILNRNKTKTVDDESKSMNANEKIMYLNPSDYILLKLKLY